jgi:fluoride exporter
MSQLLLVGAGGFLGAIARFLISKYTVNLLGAFPLGTLIVNVSGSFFLGLIYYLALNSKIIPADFKNFAGVGFIGAFTTMSTFAYETIKFGDTNDYVLFAVNLLSNIALCLGAIILGKHAALVITRFIS